MRERKYRTKTEVVDVTAKDQDGNVKGTGTVKKYSENKAGFDLAGKEVGYANVMFNYNRQAETDVKNDLRTERDETAKDVKKLLSLVENHPSLAPAMIADVATWDIGEDKKQSIISAINQVADKAKGAKAEDIPKEDAKEKSSK